MLSDPIFLDQYIYMDKVFCDMGSIKNVKVEKIDFKIFVSLFVSPFHLMYNWHTIGPAT